MRRFILSLSFIAFVSIPYSAIATIPDEADSLKIAMEMATSIQRFEILQQLSKIYESKDPSQSLIYAQDAEKEAKTIRNYELVGKALNRIGVAYYQLDEIDHATKKFLEALHIFDSLNNHGEMARELNNIGWMYRTINNHDEALRYFNEGLALASEMDDKQVLQGLLNNLGTVYRVKGQYQQALEVYKQSLEYNKTIQNKQWEAYTYNNIGLIYQDPDQYTLAKKYYSEALEINLVIGSASEQVRNILNLALAYFEENPKNGLTEEYFLKADSLINANNLKKERLVYLDYKQEMSSKIGDYKQALECHLAFTKLQKELNYDVMEEKMATMKARYDFELKQRELDLAKDKLSWQRFIIFTGSAGFLLVVGILFLGIKMYKSKVRYSYEIENLANELKIKNDDINRINENLENIVAERTQKLRLQNEKLIKYSFINSHDIRGPLARVLGLIYLLGKDTEPQVLKTSLGKLSEAAGELDQVIKETSELLHDDENFAE